MTPDTCAAYRRLGVYVLAGWGFGIAAAIVLPHYAVLKVGELLGVRR